MRALAIKAIDLVLSVPFFFKWQQKLCNHYENVRSEFQPYLDKDGLAVLDVGCSTATAAQQIFAPDRHNYYGIDLDGRYIAKAKQSLPTGHFQEMDARQMTFANESFDLIFFCGMLHHTDDDQMRTILAEAKRVLKKDGVILIAEPVFTPGKMWSNFLLSLDRGKHIRPKEGYEALLNGFKVERSGFFAFPPHRFCSFVARKRS